MSGEQLGIHNQGNWSPAKNGGGVVSDQPGGTVGGGDDVEYYGGYLIAESMDRSNIPIVVAAPKMFKALVSVRDAICGFDVSLADEIKVIDEAIAAATTPIASVQSPPVAADPVVSYVDLGPADVFVIGDQYLACGVWLDCCESIGRVRRDSLLSDTQCRRPVRQSQIEPVPEPACETKSLKPPLGIKPSVLWIESRRDDLYAAISRYRDAQYAVPAHLLVQLAAIEGFLQDDSGEAELIISHPERIGET